MATLQVGHQLPRIQHIPTFSTSAGDDVIGFARENGLDLDPWQEYVIRNALGERDDGKWQSLQCGLIVPRQNGKGAILEALELAWLFLFEEDRLILHSAHEFKTSQEAYLRIRNLIEGSDELRKLVKKFSNAHGEEGVELHDGSRLRFVARSKGSGRGFSADKIVLDECFNLPDVYVDALMPTLGARYNPQVWWTSSPGDWEVAPCYALNRVRRAGIRGTDDRLSFFEWSVPYDEDGNLQGDPGDEALWAMANPSYHLGRPHSKRHELVNAFYETMSVAGFCREELGVGNWPYEDSGEQIIAEARWATQRVPTDPDDPFWSDTIGRPALAIEMNPSRTHAAISLAVERQAGGYQVEVIEYQSGSTWVADRIKELQLAHEADVVLDMKSPAGALGYDLEEAGVDFIRTGSADLVEACGQWFDDCESGRFHHLGDPILNKSLKDSVRHRLGGAWAIDRWNSDGDTSPLVSAILAAWRHRQIAAEENYDLDESVY